MRKSGRPKPRVRVVWDEENLDLLEASKTPKQKITEPKTPYHVPTGSDGFVSPTPDDMMLPMETAVHAEAIRHALSEVASTSSGSSSRHRGGGWTSSEDEGDDRDFDIDGIEMNGNRLTFEEHRRKHYDEYRKAKMMRMQCSKPEEEEPEEDKEMNPESRCKHAPNESSMDKRIVALNLQESPPQDLKL